MTINSVSAATPGSSTARHLEAGVMFHFPSYPTIHMVIGPRDTKSMCIQTVALTTGAMRSVDKNKEVVVIHKGTPVTILRL